MTPGSHIPARACPPGSVTVLDLGTSAFRLLIASLNEQEALVGHRLARRIVRIGSGVVARGEIDEDAVDRAVPLLAAFSAVIRDDRLTRVRTVATGVLRDAANATQTVARLSAVLESPFHMLPGLQERGRQRRRLARRGCAGGLDRPVG